MIQIDIDMPKQCGECPLCVSYDCIIHKRVTDEYYDTLEEQYAHCPLTLPSAKEKPFKLPEIYVADGYDTVAGEDGNVGFGVYVPDENYICVAGDVEDEIRARALFHELCHWVQAMCGRPFNEDEANEFSDIVYDALQSAQPVARDTNDCISRQAAIDEAYNVVIDGETFEVVQVETLMGLPSAQPERTCVNCGRTVNNGGWYAGGGTRCPIEEHYALPKDGYCHLWEKRNVTDDNYPERREE